jgi:omega-6 fatty acid desaturase (delta-12 desaturase)
LSDSSRAARTPVRSDRAPATEIGALRQIASRFRTPTIERSLWQMVNTFLPFVALWAAMAISLDYSYWIALALAVPAAGLVVRIFIIQHDCGHGSFLRSRTGNAMIGRLASLVTLTPFANWKRQHALHHANWNNLDRRDSGADIYSALLTVAEYQALSRWGRLRHRMTQHPLVALILVPPFIFLALYRVPFDTPRTWRRERRSVWLTDLALLVLYGGLVWALGWRTVLMVQLPITTLAAMMGVWLFSLQHRFKDTIWQRAEHWDASLASLRGSSHLKLPKVLQWFTGSIGFHHVHHLDTGVPNYRLEACHKADPGMDAAPTLGFIAGLMAWRYALWDEDAGRTITFAGLLRRRAPAGAV